MMTKKLRMNFIIKKTLMCRSSGVNKHDEKMYFHFPNCLITNETISRAKLRNEPKYLYNYFIRKINMDRTWVP